MYLIVIDRRLLHGLGHLCGEVVQRFKLVVLAICRETLHTAIFNVLAFPKQQILEWS